MTSRLPTGLSVVPPHGASEVATPAKSTSFVPSDPSRSEVALALLVATVVLVPIAAGTVAWSAPGGDADFTRRVTFQLFDLALVLTGFARIAALLDERSGKGTGSRGAASGALAAAGRRAVTSALALSITILGTAGVIAFAVHPSPRGAELAARIGVGALVAQALIVAPGLWLGRVQAVVALVASADALLAIAQSAHGAALGGRWLEFDGPLYPFGS
jgi:hypothetical protein